MPVHISALAAAALAVAAAGCGGGESSSSATVTIKTFQFAPKPLTVKAGTVVAFRNDDAILHTVTSGPRDAPDGRFDLELPRAGATATYTFTRPGTYRYFCSIHPGPGMQGSVVVTGD